MFLFNKKRYKLSKCFCRYFEKLEADESLAASSLKKYKEIAGRIIDELGDIDVRKLNADDITKMKQALNQRGLSSARRNHYTGTLRSLLKFIKESERQSVLDYTEIKKYKEENKPVEFLTDEEVKLLLNSISETSETRLRLKALIMCLLSTGARISEILNLNIVDVDFEKGLATTRGKGGKINQVIFNELSLKSLKMYLKKREDVCPALFATRNGKRLQINCAERAVRNQGRKAGIKKRVYCHLCRKTAASKMFFSGAPLPVVSKFLSHSDIATTQKYYLRGANFEEVKGETIARLQTALKLFLSGVVSLIFCTGGYSPRRKKLGLKDSVAMMKEWLVNNGAVQQSAIGEAMSVDTGGNIEEFIQQIKKMKLSDYRLTIYLVTSWYHLFRSKRELINTLKAEGISATIISVSAFPKFDAKTLKYEYLFNLLTEPIKILSLVLPQMKFSWRKREYEARQ